MSSTERDLSGLSQSALWGSVNIPGQDSNDGAHPEDTAPEWPDYEPVLDAARVFVHRGNRDIHITDEEQGLREVLAVYDDAMREWRDFYDLDNESEPF